MKKLVLALTACLSLHQFANAAPTSDSPPTLTINQIHYEGKLSNDQAAFTLDLDAEATGECTLPLLSGDIAVLPSQLPDALKIIREENRYRLVARRAGHYKFQLAIIAKIQHSEPWNQVTFTGPTATIASVTAQAAGTDTEVELLDGTTLSTVKTNGVEQTTGYLGADQTINLRWQARAAEVVHQALLTADSTLSAQITPTVIKYQSRFHYEVVQGSTTQLSLTLATNQTLTRIEGDQIRDWHLTSDANAQTLTVEFIKPVDGACDLTVYSEQPVENINTHTTLDPPQPIKVERESGVLTIAAEDVLAEMDAPANLTQVNAPDNAIAAYQFSARPLTLGLSLKPVIPEVASLDRVSARLEEARLVVLHRLTLNVTKAGIYTLELVPQPGMSIADVRGDGIEDWNVRHDKIEVDFSARILGSHTITIQLEQALKSFPKKINLQPLRITGAIAEAAQIGADAVPGIQIRTGDLSGLREIPVTHLSDPSNETLAYEANQPGWNLSLSCEKLTARIVANVFNLVTVGDGSVGGSATIRYSLANQGVQEFKVRVPSNLKNIEFTGPNIRHVEQNGEIWTIDLQAKAWSGYTLVVTYDQTFDPDGDTLAIGGIHALDAERETGSIALATAASLQLTPHAADAPLQRIDETELASADRSFITHAVALAYQYAGNAYDLSVEVKHYAEVPVLEAVADHTQITSVITGSGEMLTQASFKVKNNTKQFQRFDLPSRSRLWGCYVNGQPVKPQQDGNDVLVSLPHEADRDQTFTVDILYAQTNGVLASTFGKPLTLEAPRTDVPNTYAEWQLYVPPTFRLSDFGGSMSVAQGTTYGLLDAWKRFLTFYGQVLREAGDAIVFIGLLAGFIMLLVISAVRRGWNGILTLFAVTVVLAILGAMLLPALSAAKRKAQRISSVNNLKQVGLALRIYSGDHNDNLPKSFEEMQDELSTQKITYDVETGQRFIYLGAGMSADNIKPDSVLVYSPIYNGHCEVLYADGSVGEISAEQFGELSQRGLVELDAPTPANGQPAQAPLAQSAPEHIAANATLSPLETGTAATYGGSIPAPITSTNNSSSPGLEAVNAPPTASGIRSIHIDVPTSGQLFLFTKVLNIQDEPLSIRAHIMPLHTYTLIQTAWQTAAFLMGLCVWCIQWRRVKRNSFVLTLALALIIGSVCSLLVEWRALHDLLIIGFPVVFTAAIAFFIWKYWPRTPQPVMESIFNEVPPAAPETGIPPVAVAIAILLTLSFGSAHAANTDANNPMFPANNAAIVSANYSGAADSHVATITANLEISSPEAGQILPIFGNDVAVEQFSATRGKAELVRLGHGLAVKVGRGQNTLKIKLLVKITGDVTRRQLAFNIPAALSSQISLTLDEPDADVDFPTALSYQRTLKNNQTQIEAVFGSSNQAQLSWTPRVRHTGETSTILFCQNASLISFSRGMMDIRTTLNYQITQGELRQARVQLPVGQRLLRVEGDGVRTWEIKTENNTPILVVDLLKDVSSTWQLTIETEKNVNTLPASLDVAVPHALDIKRETGLVALRSSDELDLSVESTAGLQRVDTGEFTAVSPDQTNGLVSVFQFPRPEFQLRTRIAAILPEIEAVMENDFHVNNEQVNLASTINYHIKRTGIFSLKIALPADYRVDQVSGDNIQQQNEQDENGQRILFITLRDRTINSYTLKLNLVRDFKTLPSSLAIAGPHPLDLAKLTEFIGVTADPGVSVKTASFNGLAEIPAIDLPNYAGNAGNGSVLAYKFIATDATNTLGWSLTIATERLAAWLQAEIVNNISLTETLASGHALIRYQIANAPVKELVVRVPSGFQNVEISGPNIRSREQNGDLWHVELQSPISGDYILNVTWEQPSLTASNIINVDGISTKGTDRESGLLAISTQSPLQVSEASVSNLQRVDAGDFPEWAGAPDNTATLIYHYTRPNYELKLSSRRLDEAEVLQAIIENAQLTSVVADDGQMMTEMALALRSNGRQFLEIQLPDNARVWSAFVAGQPVRPSLRNDKLLLPIESTASGDDSIPVQLTYVGTNAFPQKYGTVNLTSPQFDVPLKNARWEIYLPLNYDYEDFHGSMTHELVLTPESASSSFSILEYSEKEQQTKSIEQTEFLHDVEAARRSLADGNIRQASANLNYARTRLPSGGFAAGSIKKLQKDLQSAQASNLVAAQDAFTAMNGASPGNEIDQAMPIASSVQYDQNAAGEQWSKLQEAQEIVSTRVQPLHVNLPVRGQHFAFNQVLQTETGKPLTIQLYAANIKAVSWPRRLLTVFVTFGGLWLLVVCLCRLTSQTKAD